MENLRGRITSNTFLQMFLLFCISTFPTTKVLVICLAGKECSHYYLAPGAMVILLTFVVVMQVRVLLGFKLLQDVVY